MKRTIFTLLCAIGALFIAGCTALTPTEYPELTDGLAFEIHTQYDTYAPDAEVIHAVLYNGTDESLHFGADWSMEVLREDGWYALPFVENACWISIAYELMPAGTFPFEVHTNMLNKPLKEGTYRIIKKISGIPCAAEFTVAKDGMGRKDAPFGYAPLDSLPDNYTKTDALSDGVIIVEDVLSDTARLTEFFTSVSLSMPSQIRLAQVCEDGSLVLTDVLAEKELQTWRIRVRIKDGDTVTTNYYSHFLYFNGDLAVGNTAEWSMDLEEQTHFLLAENQRGDVRTVIQPWLDRHAGDKHAAFWSPDGMKLVKLNGEKLDFALSYLYEDGGQSGSVEEITGVPGMKKITGAAWNGDSRTVMLICETDRKEMTGYVFYSAEENKVISYTSSFSMYGYDRDENGNIIIPE